MGTIQRGTGPGGLKDAGDHVIHASEMVDTKPVKDRFVKFVTIHKKYLAADAVVAKASQALSAQQAKVGDADVTQDERALELASALAGDGLPRTNPFKPFGAPAPSDLVGMGYEAEAKLLIKLADTVLKRKGLSKKTIDCAKSAKKAAEAVLKELAPIEKLEKARSAAIIKRDALEQPWQTAFAALKRGAKAAEDDGATGLYTALFVTAEPTRRKSSSKGAKKKADGAAKGKGKGAKAEASKAEAPKAEAPKPEAKAEAPKPAANGKPAAPKPEEAQPA